MLRNMGYLFKELPLRLRSKEPQCSHDAKWVQYVSDHVIHHHEGEPVKGQFSPAHPVFDGERVESAGGRHDGPAQQCDVELIYYLAPSGNTRAKTVEP